MKRNHLPVVAVAAALTLSLTGTGCAKLEARDRLNKGVQAFKSAKYSDAIENFKRSIELDPSYPTARLYLATAYRQQWVPGGSDAENIKNLENARAEFNKVLSENPQNKVALEQLASIAYDEVQGITDAAQKQAKLKEAEDWYLKLTQADPNKATAFYSLGVIQWMKWYPTYGNARRDMGMKLEDPGPMKDKKIQAELREKWLPTINQGVDYLNKAMAIDPEYDDAMAYLNLLIRERGDLATTPEEYKKDIDTANQWVEKALETRKVKAQRALNKPGGIKTDE